MRFNDKEIRINAYPPCAAEYPDYDALKPARRHSVFQKIVNRKPETARAELFKGYQSEICGSINDVVVSQAQLVEKDESIQTTDLMVERSMIQITGATVIAEERRSIAFFGIGRWHPIEGAPTAHVPNFDERLADHIFESVKPEE